MYLGKAASMPYLELASIFSPNLELSLPLNSERIIQNISKKLTTIQFFVKKNSKGNYGQYKGRIFSDQFFLLVL